MRDCKTPRLREPLTIVLLTLTCLSIFALSACGLQDYVFLGPPQNVINTGSTVLHFENNISNDPGVFRGYKVLYRFYASDTAAAQARAQIESDYNRSPTTIFNTMLGRGYRELLFNENSRILISNIADRNDAFSLELRFDTRDTGVEVLFSSVSVPTNPSLPATVRRNAKDTSQEYYDFSDSNITINDSDLTAAQFDSSVSPSITYLQCYVLSYGISTANGVEEVYSQPVWFNGNLIQVAEED